MSKVLESDFTYADVLRSEGFTVDYAICTSYSLNLQTLLSIPFMMGTMSELTDEARRSPHILLETINMAAGKFVVFCNAGCISVPQKESKVFSLLERSVVQVALSARGKGFINFHPKVWIIKETNKDIRESWIKVVVMSRNLTTSSDLDVVCELKAKIGEREANSKLREKHAPLKRFIDWLRDKTHDRDIRNNMGRISADIDKLKEFNTEGSMFNDYDFFPMGIEKDDGQKCLNGMLKHATDMLIISPFIDQTTAQKLTDYHTKSYRTLITRYSSITEDIISNFKDKGGVYAVKEELVDNAEKEIAIDIHEKVYFVHDNHLGNLLYLGSTNATHNGFNRNVEFLLRLTFARNRISYQSFRQELINDDKECMFELVDSIIPESEAKEDLTNELDLRQAIAAIKKASVTQEGEDLYQVSIQCGGNMPKTQVKIYPLCFGEGKSKELTDGVIFHGLTLSMLTEFYILAVGENDILRRVIKIETSGIPKDERDKAIYSQIIDTPSKFIQCISHMLTEDNEQYLLESLQAEKDHQLDSSNISKSNEVTSSLYEDMVRAAYKSQEGIKSMRKMVDMVDEKVIPEGFVDMYDKFEKAIKKIKRL